MKMEKRDKLNLIIFIILAVIVGIGWIYGLTSKDSELNQAFRKAPTYMNILGILWFLAGSFITYKIAMKMRQSASLNIWIPVVISIAVTIVGAILIAADGFINIF